MENNGVLRLFGADIPRGEERNDVVFESEVIREELDPFGDSRIGLVRVPEGSEKDQFVRTGFNEAMSGLGLRTRIESIYHQVSRDITSVTKLLSFVAMTYKLKGTGEGEGGKVTKCAWFGGSKEEINNIFRFGFASRGRGICISPFDNPAASLRACVADENGLHHLILCRAVFGEKFELLPPNLEQQFPSSEDVICGVDNLESPTEYMVWSSYMNTHVMPQYVVSFRPPVAANPVNLVEASEGDAATRTSRRYKIIRELEPVVPASSLRMIEKLYKDLSQGKMSKLELVQELKKLVGGDVLHWALVSIRREKAAAAAAAGDSNDAVRAQRKAGANKVLKKLHGAGSS